MVRTVKYWYVPLILGLVFLALGVWGLAAPAAAFVTLVMFFSIGFVSSGALEIFYAVSNRKTLKNWGWHLTGGMVTLLFGIYLLASPVLTALIFASFIGFWLLFRSVLYISNSISLKKAGEKNWRWLLAFGIVGVILSFILIGNPIVAGITVAFWAGFGLVILGLLNIVISFTVKHLKDELGERTEDFLDRH